LLRFTGTNVEEPAEKLVLELSDGKYSYLGNLIMVIVVLALIVGLIILTIRFLAHKNSSWYQARSVRHMGGIGVGQNKSVQLVKIGSNLFVVGVGDNVQLLEKIDDKTEIDLIMQSLNAPANLPGRGWIASIQRWMDARRHATSSQENRESPEAHSFQELFHSKMQQVGQQRTQLREMLNDDNTKDGTRR